MKGRRTGALALVVLLAGAAATRGQGGTAELPPGAEMMRGIAASNPLVAVATAWRQAVTVAAAGTFPKGAEPEPGVTYQLVCLGADQRPGAGPGAAAARAYTREAFAASWAAVAPGGLLAWFAADEAVFARGVLQMADLLDDPGTPGRWSAAAMALRLPASSTLPYKWALLVSRGPFEAEAPARVAALERNLPVQVLFGPGVEGRGPWGAAAARAAADARAELCRELSRRAGRWLDLRAATTQRPGFFDLDPVAPAVVRAAAGGSLLALLAALLLPLPHRRRAGGAEATRWPLPLLLIATPAPVAAAVLAVAAVAGRTFALGGGPLGAAAGAVAGAFAGAVLARVRPAWPARPAHAALAGALAAIGGHLALGPLAAAGPVTRALAAATWAGGVTWLAASAFAASHAAFGRALPEARPLGRVLVALGLVAAATSAPWLVHWQGYPAVWIAAAACFAAAALGAAALGRPVRAGSG